MSSTDSRLPVIIGVGQTVERDDASSLNDLPTAQSLAIAACRAAIRDSGIKHLATHIDTVAFVRLNSDSIEARPSPFGRCDNLPRATALAIGANPTHAIYSQMGGQAPQQLLNEAANLIAAGERDVILLTGSEAIRAMKHAQRQKWTLDWAEHVEGQLDDRGIGRAMSNPYEIANGMGFPPQVYGAFENAWRHQHGLTKDQARQHMSELFAPFSQVAAANPYAQFPQARSVEFLATPSYDNYAIAEPYLKWHVAQDAVNQGAALILTSVAKARELGVAQEKWVYPLAGADARDKDVSARASLTASAAMAAALARVFDTLGKGIDDIAHMDLYSCFPCAVQFACEAMGIDPLSRKLTQTGGLAFFGGAGNNYSMHGIASLVDTLRADPGSIGLVLANGGFLTKDSAGLYSTTPNRNWQPVDNTELQARLDAVPDVRIGDASAGGRIETYSVVYEKNVPFIGYAFLRNDAGERFMARTIARDERTLNTLIDEDPLGEFITPRVTDKRNELVFD